MGRVKAGELARCRLPLALVAAAVFLFFVVSLPSSSDASFAGANGKIFYRMSVSGTAETDLFSINPDGSGLVDLTAENGFSEERPSVSADGQHVVFQSFRDGGWNIFSMNADGSGVSDLTNTKDPAVVNFEPTWSPDGTKVAFMRQAGGNQDIWVVNANGTNPVDLTEGAAQNETAPEFSPDGTKILYVAAGPLPCCTTEYNNDIWVMNANGTGQTQLTHTNLPTQNVGATWSPDGMKIAYSTSETPGATDNGIHVMDANGANQTRLLFEGNPIPTNILSWSPDGAKIAYEGGGGEFIYTMNANGSASAPLVVDGPAREPSWAPAVAPPGPSPGSPAPATSGSSPAPVPIAAPVEAHCVVPKLQGKTLKAAKQKLQAANCKLGHVAKKEGVTAKTGKVVKQSPKPGTTLAVGSKVSVKLG
jgi:Tol biopolymer transport system component